MISSRAFCLSLLVLSLGCNGVNKNKPLVTLSDSTFNKVKLADLKSNVISLEKFEGKTIFLNFWAIWCKPCIAEMPTIGKAQTIRNKEDIVFLIASSESVEEIDAFKKSA